ncbi:MAG: carbohydrate ABC transporter permease [Eubacteriales bacterium]|nr:carbohydrate ABC transporter permease [Eubacteriales bacterium]
MVKDRSASAHILGFLLTLMSVLVILMVMVPILNVFAISFSSYEAFTRGEVGLWPVEWSLKAYQRIFSEGIIPRGLFNSVVYTLLGTTVNMVLTTLTAYPLSRSYMPMRKTLSAILTFPLLFSGGMVPTFLLVSNLGLYNTIWALVIPNAIAVYYLTVMRTALEGIPAELNEAATLDGASEFMIFMRITLPLSKATLAAVALFYAVGHWNSWFDASIYLKSSAKYPLQLVLRNNILSNEAVMQTGEGNNIGITSIQYASLFISMIPMMLVYPFIQKYFVKGVMIGSVKG